MKKTSTFGLILLCLTLLSSCNGQIESKEKEKPVISTSPKIVGGGCDGCELMYEGMPKNIASIDTSSAWNESGQKLLITGKALRLDGKTPAPNVIIYYWQTDNDGYYSDGQGKSSRHGHIRGWILSDKNGDYALYTIRPAPYPNRDSPAHIHLSIKEPTIDDEYYTDNLVFDDDILLTIAQREKLENRGGNGILKPHLDKGVQIATHNIILGLHIPNYPKN